MSNQGSPTVPLPEVRPGQRLQVINTRQQRLLVTELVLALGPWSRLRGLLGRPAPAEEGGLLLRPCRGVHTFFMAYPIDVAFLDEQGEVVLVCEELRPWRATPYLGSRACCALELAAGRLRRSGTRPGDRLAFQVIEEPPGARAPV